MLSIGQFFFKYRNFLFIFLYTTLFFPSPSIFTYETYGDKYFLIPITFGLLITVFGQIIRGVTIGLAYILRGGQKGRPYADGLVREGIFSHCRNPLYVGNLLMLLGLGIFANSLIFLVIIMPIFYFIYFTIVLAEEQYLRNKYGLEFGQYCANVNRWMIKFSGIQDTFKKMKFNWKRWILKEYNTQYIWLSAIVLVFFLKYCGLLPDNRALHKPLLFISLFFLLLIYLIVRFLKKTKRLTE